MRVSAAARGAVRPAHVFKADHSGACLAVALAHDDFVGPPWFGNGWPKCSQNDTNGRLSQI
jgi:hypothetical protein